ncbi:hypothetical protein [Tardiphaga sp.]|uniref:hypothetical protein n=1 Tax=Tardiphaga sp. TaxID=1926292 RepID=UPI0037DA1767
MNASDSKVALRFAHRLVAFLLVNSSISALTLSSVLAETIAPSSRRSSLSQIEGLGRPGSASANIVSLAQYPHFDPTGRLPSDTAVSAWWQDCIAANRESGSSGKVCYLPPAKIRMSRSFAFDFSGNRDGGGLILGAGQNGTLFIFDDGASMSVINSRGGGVFYGTFQNFGVIANNSKGPAVMLGQHDFSDFLNGFALRDIFVKNRAGVEGSSGIEVNGFGAGQLNNVTTSAGCTDDHGHCPVGGDSLLLRRAQFSQFSGSFSGGKNGIALRDSYSFGNSIISPDIEVVYNGIYQDSAYANANSVYGGQWSWCTRGVGGPCRENMGFAIVSKAGSLIVNNPNFSFSDSVTDGRPENSVGILTTRGASIGVSTPPVAASGSIVTNVTTRRVAATLFGITARLDNVCYGPAAGTCTGPVATGGTVTVILQPNDQLRLTYAGAKPGMSWSPIQ